MENYCLCCTESHQSATRSCSLSWMIFGVKPVPSLCLSLHLFACVLRRLSSRLDNIRKTACGDGQSHCLLCGASFGPQGVTAVLCVQCKKVGGYLDSFCLNRDRKQTLHLFPENVRTGFLFTIFSILLC